MNASDDLYVLYQKKNRGQWYYLRFLKERETFFIREFTFTLKGYKNLLLEWKRWEDLLSDSIGC